MTGLLAPGVLESFERDGFVNAGRLLEQTELDEIRAELERHVGASFHDKETGVEPSALKMNLSVTPNDDVYQLTGIWMQSEVFFRLIRHPKIARAGAELARSNLLQFWSDQVMYKPARKGGPINWHQDAPYFQAISPAVSLTAWVSLDDADVETGCMWMVPGSYKWGVLEPHLWAYKQAQIEIADFETLAAPTSLPDLGAEWPGARPCPTKAGDVHFHHCLTWHGSPANRSGRTRRSYAIHYMPAGVVFNGTPDPRVERAGITSVGTSMREASQDWFPVVYEHSA